ncbi:hypothetical protein BC830DRAFT_1146726 [Chytriomyces sp. MP71]|nr:hypothetical protein BC830DRAFT_1146726 [Chytriomyces sp. MP71]
MDVTLDLLDELQSSTDSQEWRTLLEQLLGRCQLSRIRELLLLQEEHDVLDMLAYIMETSLLETELKLQNADIILLALQIIRELVAKDKYQLLEGDLNEGDEVPADESNPMLILHHPTGIISLLLDILVNEMYCNMFSHLNLHPKSLRVMEHVCFIIKGIFNGVDANPEAKMLMKSIEWRGWKVADAVLYLALKLGTISSVTVSGPLLELLRHCFDLGYRIGNFENLLAVCHALLKLHMQQLEFNFPSLSCDNLDPFMQMFKTAPIPQLNTQIRFESSPIICEILHRIQLISQSQLAVINSIQYKSIMLQYHQISQAIRLESIKTTTIHDPCTGLVAGNAILEICPHLKSILRQMEASLSSYHICCSFDQIIDGCRKTTSDIQSRNGSYNLKSVYCQMMFYISVFEQSRFHQQTLKYPDTPCDASHPSITKVTIDCLADSMSSIFRIGGAESGTDLILISSLQKKLKDCFFKYTQSPENWCFIIPCIKLFLSDSKSEASPSTVLYEDEVADAIQKVFDYQSRRLQSFVSDWKREKKSPRARSASNWDILVAKDHDFERIAWSAHASDSGLTQQYQEIEEKCIEAFVCDGLSKFVSEIQSISSRQVANSIFSEILKRHVSFICKVIMPASVKMSATSISKLPSIPFPPSLDRRSVNRSAAVRKLPPIQMK